MNKIESASDPRLSSIRRFVEAVGRASGVPATVEVTATFGKERIMIEFATDTSGLGTHQPPANQPHNVGARAWRLRAWGDPLIEQAMVDGDVIAVSADELGDLSDKPSRGQLAKRLRAAPVLGDRGDQAIGTFATYWDIFLNRMDVGDVVAVPMAGRRVAVAEITGDYEYRGKEEESRLRHVRPVRWLTRGAPRLLLDDDLKRVVNAPGTVCALAQPRAADRLRRLSG